MGIHVISPWMSDPGFPMGNSPRWWFDAQLFSQALQASYLRDKNLGCDKTVNELHLQHLKISVVLTRRWTHLHIHRLCPLAARKGYEPTSINQHWAAQVRLAIAIYILVFVGLAGSGVFFFWTFEKTEVINYYIFQHFFNHTPYTPSIAAPTNNWCNKTTHARQDGLSVSIKWGITRRVWAGAHGKPSST